MLMKKKKNSYLQSCAYYKFRGIKAYSQPHEKVGIILPLQIHIVRILLKDLTYLLTYFQVTLIWKRSSDLLADEQKIIVTLLQLAFAYNKTKCLQLAGFSLLRRQCSNRLKLTASSLTPRAFLSGV